MGNVNILFGLLLSYFMGGGVSRVYTFLIRSVCSPDTQASKLRAATVIQQSIPQAQIMGVFIELSLLKFNEIINKFKRELIVTTINYLAGNLYTLIYNIT